MNCITINYYISFHKQFLYFAVFLGISILAGCATVTTVPPFGNTPDISEKADRIPITTDEKADRIPATTGEKADRIPTRTGEIADRIPTRTGEIADRIPTTTGEIADRIPTTTGEKATRIALSMVGRPYKYRGNSPAGFDCSGLVQYSYVAAGLDVPHGTKALRSITVPTGDNMQIGDLLFFNERGKKYSHVGIYLGNDTFVHAPGTGGQVEIESLEDPHWQSSFVESRLFMEPPLRTDQ